MASPIELRLDPLQLMTIWVALTLMVSSDDTPEQERSSHRIREKTIEPIEKALVGAGYGHLLDEVNEIGIAEALKRYRHQEDTSTDTSRS